jgi:hypothetical protein
MKGRLRGSRAQWGFDGGCGGNGMEGPEASDALFTASRRCNMDRVYGWSWRGNPWMIALIWDSEAGQW